MKQIKFIHIVEIIGVILTGYLVVKPEKIEYITKVEQIFMENKQEVSKILPISPIVEIKEEIKPTVVKETPVTLIKETVKLKEVKPVEVKPAVVEKATTTEIIATSTPKEEVKLDPFEVVKWDFTFENGESEAWSKGPGNQMIYKKAYIKATQRQGTLATVNSCDWYIKLDEQNYKKEEARIAKINNNSYIIIPTVYNEQYGIRTFIKCQAFYNTGKEVKYFESDWREVR